MWLDSFVCVGSRSLSCDVLAMHSRVHHSLMSVNSLIRMCDMTRLYVWDVAVRFAMHLCYDYCMRAMTHSGV